MLLVRHGIRVLGTATAPPLYGWGDAEGRPPLVSGDIQPQATPWRKRDELREHQQPGHLAAGLCAIGGGLRRYRRQGSHLPRRDAARPPDARRTPPHDNTGFRALGAVESPRRTAHGGRSIEISSTAQSAGGRRARARSGDAAPLSVEFQGIYR